MKKFRLFGIPFAAVLLTLAVVFTMVTSAFASATFDPSSGTGFVGKGDVQSVFGLNNGQIQSDANNIGFTYNSAETQVTEQTWECTNSNNDHLQQRLDTTTTTTSTTGVVDSVTRVKNQVTGFNLSGFTSTTTNSSSSTEGPTLNSCPANPSGWYLSSPAGPPVVVSDSTDQYLAASDSADGLSPASTALDGANVWHLTNGLNPVTGSVNYGTANGSVY
jgi:hypothetical protein